MCLKERYYPQFGAGVSLLIDAHRIAQEEIKGKKQMLNESFSECHDCNS